MPPPARPANPGGPVGGAGGGTRLRSFHELMRRRVRRILLVCSLYDAFVLSEEGRLIETLLAHFLEVGRTLVPDLELVPDGAAALARLRESEDFDLVVSSVLTGEVGVLDLTRTLREEGIDVPVVALGHTGGELRRLVSEPDVTLLEGAYLWQGDVRVFSAIVLALEDRMNVAHDTVVQGVPALMLVEDNVSFYSAFLPAIYSELFEYTQRLLSEDLTLTQRTIRMRARPKLLFFRDYDSAWEAFERYGDYVLGVISDIEYPRGGRLEPLAGVELCRAIRERRPDVRLVLQSSREENAALAAELEASFLVKGAPAMVQELRRILVERFGFGDFRFRDEAGEELGRAKGLRELAQRIEELPAESTAYHCARGHLPNWLKARTEFWLAERVQAECRALEGDPEGVRDAVLAALEEHRQYRAGTVIANFDRKRFDPRVAVTRIGGGAMGGKARGLVFLGQILAGSGVRERFPDLDVYVPPCVVLGTDVFDEFMSYELMAEFAAEPRGDDPILELMLQAPFPRAAGADLRHFLSRVKEPLAVRSSSLMEDSRSQPFAGIYQTYMLGNDAHELDVRARQLGEAVKRVYASTYSERAKAYMAATAHQLDEEKMGVIVQRLVGRRHGDLFYPDFSGVARSHNFYPEPGQAPEDGVAAVALGMGRTVVSGEPCLRFCPRHPRHLIGFSSVQDALGVSQRDFHGLDLAGGGFETTRRRIDEADDEVLAWLGSTYVAADDRIVDGTSRPGVRLVTFAQVLKHGAYPLAELLSALLAEGTAGTGGPVEIEFAGELGGPGRPPRFALLQLRPMALSPDSEPVDLQPVPDEAVLCRSTKVLGNGRIDDIVDVVVVDREGFDRNRTREVASEVARLDAGLRKEGRPYLLVGVGRWGSADPSLGIPVAWSQIAGARVIVEAGFEDLRVTPSQGTHFFQNLTSTGVGYFTVNPDVGEGLVDWAWLAGVEAVESTGLVRRLRLSSPAVVEMDGRSGEGVILKPAG